MLKNLLNKLPSLAFHRKVQVLYTAPGFLNGTYMYEGSKVTEADLVKHAVSMRYPNYVLRDASHWPHVNIVVKEVWS